MSRTKMSHPQPLLPGARAMLRLHLFLTLLLCLPALSAAHLLTRKEVCFIACMDAFFNATFATTDPAWMGAESRCIDYLRISSTYACMQQRCTAQEIHDGVHWLEDACLDELGTAPPSYASVIANLTGGGGGAGGHHDGTKLANLPVVSGNDVVADRPFNTTIVPSQALFDAAHRTWDDWTYQFWTHHYYGYATYAFWGLVLLAGMLNRLTACVVAARAASRRHGAAASSAEPASPYHYYHGHGRHGPKWLSSARAWAKRRVLLPATFGYRHLQPLGWCSLPTRLQSVLVALFVVINVIMCAVDFRAFSENIFWPNKSQQTWTYVSDRAAVVAVSNLPLLFVFASRNDVFMWLTGWSFATFNMFHRWIARVITVEAILHGVGYTVKAFHDGGAKAYQSYWKEEYWYTGVIVLISWCLLLLFSSQPFRQRVYELFVTIHIVLSLIGLVVLFYHVKPYEGQYLPYLWPCVAIWVFDRFVRLVRLAVLNGKLLLSFAGSRERRRRMLADASYDAAANIIRLSVPQPPTASALPGMRPQAGVHYFLYFPTVWRALGNHPFTLAGWTPRAYPDGITVAAAAAARRGSASSTPDSPVSLADEKHAAHATTTAMTTTSSSSNAITAATPSAATSPRLIFLLRPYGGLTHHLRRALRSTSPPGAPKRFPVFVEGPYGAPAAAPVLGPQYDTLLFIAGGSGITVMLAYLQQYAENRHAALSSQHHHHRQQRKSVHVVWAARELAFVQRVLDDDLGAVLATDAAAAAAGGGRSAGAGVDAAGSIRLDVYITGASSAKSAFGAAAAASTATSVIAAADDKIADMAGHGRDAAPSSAVTFHMQRRPDVARIIADGARDAVGRAAVLVCGPAALADDARRAVVRAVGDGHESLGYFEESFGW